MLEAMSCGAPVIASRDPALIELAGGAVIHCDSGDEGQWVEAMRAMILNSSRRDQLREAGLQRSKEFSWRRTATLTREVYVEAISRFRRLGG